MKQQHKVAYDAVRAAQRLGILSKPTHCARCNEPEKKGTDGRSLLHGHHHDYSKPLDVEWLCTNCHKHETRWPKGSEHHKAILSERLVRAAILLREEGFDAQEIANFYRVSRQAISHATTGKNWLQERAK